MAVQSPFQVRQATAEDAQAISAIGHASFSDTFGHLFTAEQLQSYLARVYGVNKITSSLGKPNNQYWVVTEPGNPKSQAVGFLKVKWHSPCPALSEATTIQLQKMYVLPQYQRSGVGHQLMDVFLATWHEAHPQQSVWLQVLGTNEKAKAFYTRYGFVPRLHDDVTIETNPFRFVVMSLDPV